MQTFQFHGYVIPEHLAVLTGGGGSTFEVVSAAQMGLLQRYAGLEPDQRILEVGCGVGKLAILLTKALSGDGRYVGVDILKDSIQWCCDNITPRYSNFTFHHLDALSHMYNPDASSAAFETRFPIEDGTIDRIVLYSVFTHMFEPDIRHYLSEFRRLLKPSGRVLATWFLIDDESLRSAREHGSPLGDLRFMHRISMGCYVNVISAPLGAVGYTLPCLEQMVGDTGLRIAAVERGYWAGVHPNRGQSGQDTTILELAAT